MNIGFIGLGVMGGPMATNLVGSAQHQLKVFDIDASRVSKMVDCGALAANSIAEVVCGVDVVLTSLPGPTQIEAVAFAADGLFERLEPSTVWIDLSTNNLDLAGKLRARARDKDIGLLDAPVSGGDEGACAGDLTILVGGDRELFERFVPLFEVIGTRITHLGAHGAGYSAKIAQVILCYLHSLALSEALMLGIKGGVDPTAMLSIIQNSTASSYVADRYGPPILAGDYDASFTVGLAHKDLNLAREMADALGLQLPMCNLTASTYARALEIFGFDANHLRAVRLLEQDNDTFLRASTER